MALSLEEKAAFVEDWCQRNTRSRDQLLPLLHAIQEEMGMVDDALVPFVARALNLSHADVHGVISFYHDFRRTAAARNLIKLCRAESCQARGGAEIERAAEKRLGTRMGQSRADGHVMLEPVFCLGLCAVGPNAMVNGRPVARIDAAALDRIAEEIAA